MNFMRRVSFKRAEQFVILVRCAGAARVLAPPDSRPRAAPQAHRGVRHLLLDHARAPGDVSAAPPPIPRPPRARDSPRPSMMKHKLVDFIMGFMEDVDREISGMKIAVNTRGRTVASEFMKRFL